MYAFNSTILVVPSWTASFVAGVNASNGFENFNTTFYPSSTSAGYDYINANPNIGVLNNSSQIAIGVRIDKVDGNTATTINGEVCSFPSKSWTTRLRCTWIVIT